ncbi:MAG TPA: hypothetical protein VGI81_01060 [Tepidisphaeraceae bacterium]
MSDALAGRMMRCPGCGDEVPVAAAGPAGGRGGAKTRQGGPAFEISGGQRIAIGVGAVLLVIGGLFFFGPMRVWNQWATLQPKASQNVQDLIIDSLREKMKQEDPDPKYPKRQPTVETNDVNFFQPMLAFTMPTQVGFIGKSNQGSFGGNYNTQTGEVDATVYYGGYAVAGMVDVTRPKGTFHLVGRMVDGKPQMEIDGQKI